MRTPEVVAALQMAASIFKQEQEVIALVHAYAHQFGGKPGCNVFEFLLEDALRARGVSRDWLQERAL